MRCEIINLQNTNKKTLRKIDLYLFNFFEKQFWNNFNFVEICWYLYNRNMYFESKYSFKLNALFLNFYEIRKNIFFRITRKTFNQNQFVQPKKNYKRFVDFRVSSVLSVFQKFNLALQNIFDVSVLLLQKNSLFTFARRFLFDISILPNLIVKFSKNILDFYLLILFTIL